MSRKIPLTQGKHAIVDDEDYEFLNQWKWYVSDKGYARRNAYIGDRKQKTILMHRVINKTPDGMHTDHVNMNPLDNRKGNLRACSMSQNNMNRRKHGSFRTSSFKGVRFEERINKYRAVICIDGRQTHLGVFAKEEDAAKAYNDAAIVKFGKFAQVNTL